ncbi:uncharacterized protein LOC108162825 [Drosophila miranda]|uniref:uncharacterized protein LOC108162825 n=1 Tax=Drosophila miranda TaxID=7229 RepID=UPI00143FABD2|nr:uncharacterized protein LOC108162825 [Drosophila miranda]
MLKRCLWTITLPWIVLSQTYYMNFIFNNYRYVDRERKEVHTDRKNYTKNMTIEEETLEINSIESETLEITSKQIAPKPAVSYEDWPSLESHESELSALNTDEDDNADEVDKVDNIIEIIHNNGKPKKTTTITTERLTTKRHITKHTTREPTTEQPMIKYPVANKKKKPNREKPVVNKGSTVKVVEVTTEKLPNCMLIDIIADSGKGAQKETTTKTPERPRKTTPKKPRKTTPKKPIETTPKEPPETTPEEPIETTPEEPIETNPKEPIETIPEEPVETIPGEPIDTNPKEPIETIPEEPIETVLGEPIDTNPKEPIETTPEEPTEITTEADTADGTSNKTTELKTVTPHPPEFFHYPGAKCHEELDLHELFGISLERDRGLPSKVFCDFNNDWGGPWYLMTRIELPSRVHMRHWFFGYLTDDYNDMNINFISLAHIMNSMRIAMLIIGQDNNDKLVYNLYDDVVISGFNDLFMLRKAQLVEANTTDLLFVSVGDVINTFSGRNRSCPFHVMGGWWGFNTWRPTSQYFCVFPVDRDIKRPGFIAIFIKPSPFAVNNTALYENVITTRRPWVPTVDAILMEQANHDQKVYYQLRNEEFLDTKRAALAELGRRSQIFRDFNKNRIMDNGQPLGPT